MPQQHAGENMLAQSNTEFIEFLRAVDGDALGIVMILGTIGIFISFIVVVLAVTRTWNNIAITRMNQKLIQDLLAKGYSPDDIERLTYGSAMWSRGFAKLLKSAKARVSNLTKQKPFHQ